MSYDHWKTTEPDWMTDDEFRGPCDSCGKVGVLSRAESCGVEVHTCAECQGYASSEFDHLVDDEE